MNKESGIAFLIALILAGGLFYVTKNLSASGLLFFLVVSGELAFINKFVKKVKILLLQKCESSFCHQKRGSPLMTTSSR
ncbi:hypothetical protein [Enterococcus sp. AZ103]|uniref:hypothetical protein n=1 Tax=Enterococcus sp. AZ103 TaxID=2774628 RepID=UPI003F20FDA8